MVHVVASPLLPHCNKRDKVRTDRREQQLHVFFEGIPTIRLGLIEEESAGSGVVRWVRLLGQLCLQKTIPRFFLETQNRTKRKADVECEKERTVRELPVTDVLQVGPSVFAHVLGGGDGTLVQVHVSPQDLGTVPRGDAAGHRTPHD